VRTDAPKRPFDLVVFDLDGTLVRRDLTIATASLAALRMLQRQGVQITMATGRILKAAAPYIQQVQVDLPVILYNGSIILDPRSKKVLYERRIQCVEAKAVLHRLKRYPIDPQLYLHPTDDVYFVEKTTPFIEAFSRKDGIAAQVVGDLEAFLKVDPLKLLLVGNRNDLLRFQGQAMNDGLKMDSVLSEHNFLELLPPGNSKGTALERLCAMLGIPLSRVVAFGDNLNDAEMLAVAGLGVAMASGARGLRKKADLVVDSVAQGLHQVFGDSASFGGASSSEGPS